MKEIPDIDRLAAMIYTKWSDQNPGKRLTDAIGLQIKAAAEDTHLQLQGYVNLAGMSVDEAMIEVRGTMYPSYLMK